MYTFNPAYPTKEHEKTSAKIVDYFSKESDISAVLLTCSCARGKATPDSCLDMAVLLSPKVTVDRRTDIERKWKEYHQNEKLFQELEKVGKYSLVDLEFSDGQFDIPYHGWTSGPDELELGIGNLLVYSVPLWNQGQYLEELKSRWLPYYSADLRKERLDMVIKYCLNNLDHIPLYVNRGLYFQSFQRLYHGFGEFLQGLFITRKTYPIAYDKWVKEQIEDILGLPSLYTELIHLLEIHDFEGDEIVVKAKRLKELVNKHIHS